MTRAPVKAYYDGECGFCTRAMERWRARDRLGRIVWHDLHNHRDELAKHGITYETAKKRMHAVDADGKIAVGSDAIAAIWDHIGAWRLAAILIRAPVIRWFAGRIYDWVADHRGERCDI